MANLKPIKNRHGEVIDYEFTPSPKMLRVVVELNKAENGALVTEEILKKCRVSQDEFDSWMRDYMLVSLDADGAVKSKKNYFLSWWESALDIGSGIEKELLRLVGMEKALEGDFNFWKEMARTFGATAPDEVTINHKHEFHLKENMTESEIDKAIKDYMGSQRAMEGSRKGAMVRIANKGRKGA